MLLLRDIILTELPRTQSTCHMRSRGCSLEGRRLANNHPGGTGPGDIQPADRPSVGILPARADASPCMHAGPSG